MPTIQQVKKKLPLFLQLLNTVR